MLVKHKAVSVLVVTPSQVPLNFLTLAKVSDFNSLLLDLNCLHEQNVTCTVRKSLYCRYFACLLYLTPTDVESVSHVVILVV